MKQETGMRLIAFVQSLFARGLLAGSMVLLAVPSAWAQEPIRVGAFLSVTGPAAFLGDPELKTLELYVERLNAEGGVLGRKLQLVAYDDAGDAEKARTFAKRLLEQDKVDLIVGGSTTGTTMAVVPMVEQAGVPFISLAGAVVIVEPAKKWVFKTPHTDRMACEKIFVDLQSRKISKVALISGSGGFDKSMRGECLKVAPKYGIEFVADETYGATDTDMTAQLTKIKGSGAQAVLNAGFGQGPAIVTRNYRQVGLTLPLYQSHGVASKEYIKLSGPAADGVRLPAAALLVADQLAAGDAQKPVVVGYSKAFEDKYKADVSTFGGHAYDGLMLAVNAVKAAGSTDKAKVRDALEATKGYVGTGGVVNMSATDHMGLDLSAFRMLEVKNGDWTLVK
jgi:branched-chain amino acid transport system substrate-binding protein